MIAHAAIHTNLKHRAPLSASVLGDAAPHPGSRRAIHEHSMCFCDDKSLSFFLSHHFPIKEKLRQLRDCIIGKRPEDENIHGR